MFSDQNQCSCWYSRFKKFLAGHRSELVCKKIFGSCRRRMECSYSTAGAWWYMHGWQHTGPVCGLTQWLFTIVSIFSLERESWWSCMFKMPLPTIPETCRATKTGVVKNWSRFKMSLPIVLGTCRVAKIGTVKKWSLLCLHCRTSRINLLSLHSKSKC